MTLDEETRRYSLGPAVLVLADAYRDGLDHRATAVAAMRRLCEATGETVTMSVLSDGRRVYVDQVTPPVEVKMTVQVGASYPLARRVVVQGVPGLPLARRATPGARPGTCPAVTDATITSADGARGGPRRDPEARATPCPWANASRGRVGGRAGVRPHRRAGHGAVGVRSDRALPRPGGRAGRASCWRSPATCSRQFGHQPGLSSRCGRRPGPRLPPVALTPPGAIATIGAPGCKPEGATWSRQHVAEVEHHENAALVHGRAGGTPPRAARGHGAASRGQRHPAPLDGWAAIGAVGSPTWRTTPAAGAVAASAETCLQRPPCQFHRRSLRIS